MLLRRALNLSGLLFAAAVAFAGCDSNDDSGADAGAGTGADPAPGDASPPTCPEGKCADGAVSNGDAGGPRCDAGACTDGATVPSDAGGLPEAASTDGGVPGDAAAPVGSNASRVALALTGHSVPFAISAPADPSVASAATVTPATLAANLVAGRALTLQAGNYGAVSVSVDNVDLIAQAGVTFASLNVSGNRFRLTGGGGTAVNGPILVAAGTRDVMFDNVSMSVSGVYDTFSLSTGIQRLAMLNSSLASSANWALIGGDGCQDVVFAKSKFDYNGATYSPMRTVGVTRLVVASSRFFSNAQGMRVHNTATGPSSYVYIAGNQLESTAAPPSALTFLDPNNGGGDGANLTMSNVWLLNNAYYRAAATEFVAIGPHTPSNVNTITVSGNRGYGAATPGTSMNGISGSMGNASVSNNLNQAYVAPPAFAGGAN